MKSAKKVGVVVAILVVGLGLAQAQTRKPARAPAVGAPDAAAVDLETMEAVASLVQAPSSSSVAGATSAAEASLDPGQALYIVAQFLQLTPNQVEALTELLRMRQETIVPLLQQIAAREQQIQALLQSGGDPAAIGQLVIEIYQLKQLIERAQQDFLAAFLNLLDSTQRMRVRAVMQAAKLQPVVEAFRTLHLL
ncbi:MAG: hypothetical protein ACRD4U_09745 [Candidatus Acidiferrales bacterium]